MEYFAYALFCVLATSVIIGLRRLVKLTKDYKRIPTGEEVRELVMPTVQDALAAGFAEVIDGGLDAWLAEQSYIMTYNPEGEGLDPDFEKLVRAKNGRL